MRRSGRPFIELIMKAIACLVSFALGCLAACAGVGSDDSTSGAGDALSASTPAHDASAPDASGKAGTATAPTDGGSDSSTSIGGSVTIDDIVCTITSSGLDTGLDRNGWTLTIEGTCPTSFNLSISGVSDGAYPQTSLTPFGSENGALLFLTTSDDNAEMFSATSIKVDRGPTSSAKATVSGTATVTDEGDTTSTHSLTYEIDY
jgi:hypothetical protein